MLRPWLMIVLLVAVLVSGARAGANEDRIAARTACYKYCLYTDGWDPVCAWNPDYPEPTFHGGGNGTVWPNKCTADCMAEYAKYPEWFKLVVKHRVSVPARCLKKVWQIYLSDEVTDPGCTVCPGPATGKPPPFTPIPTDQCLLACRDRDPWKPVCVSQSKGKKSKQVVGNKCAALCLFEPFDVQDMYYVNMPRHCKAQYSKAGKLGPSCRTCPAGKPDPDLYLSIHDDRWAARTACYKDCVNRAWDPVCVANPDYPKPTSHYSGPSVYPNMCTAKCMEKYARYVEYGNLQEQYKVTLAPRCRRDLWNIWWFDDTDPTAPASLIKKCTECPPKPE